MPNLTQPEKVFTDTIYRLDTYSATQESGLKNSARPQWLTFSDSVDSKADLLKDLDRTDLNKKYVELMDNAVDGRVLDLVALTVQNDFVGAIARDYYDIRRSRITRLVHQTAVHHGQAGGDGALKSVMLGFVTTLFKFKR